MKIRILSSALVLAICLSACSKESKWRNSKDATQETITDSTATVQSDVASLNAPERKIIKKAAMRCRVTDVFRATTGIEHLVVNEGGQILESAMENESIERKTLPYSTDSVTQVQRYTTVAHLMLKVPVAQLDTVLAAIGAQSSFINNRSLSLEDVTLKYLSNQLKSQAKQQQLSIERANTLAKRSAEVLATTSYEAEKGDENIDRTLENRSLKEQTIYATLHIELYQTERVERLIVANTDHLMKPSFLTGFKSAVGGGWQLLQDILLFLMQLWPLALVGLVSLVIYRKAKTNKKVIAGIS